VSLLLCLLFVSGWISVSVSVSQSQTVEVQSGEDVTLLCSNISRSPTQTDWFRVVNRTKASCISSMYAPENEASFCDGFQNRFEMSSNISTVFLKIKKVDVSDSGLYFCGFYKGKHTVITDAIHLNVKEIPGGMTNLMSVVLGGLTVLLTIVVIVLAVKISKLQKGTNLGSGDLNYAALSFQTKPKRNRRPASERELEPNVVYAATR
uniref:Ig-like domain-containing protein n=1 Tax=Seriola lalandi dorsalis TaxID=1841481 RepID=A0A3B4XV54_SERLL